MGLMSPRGRMAEAGHRSGIALGPDALDRLVAFVSYLVEAEERANLTGFGDDRLLQDGVAEALSLWPLVGEAERVADIGSGNGFPGMVWAIVAPERAFVLIESRAKRGAFLKEVVQRLGLRSEVRVERAEATGRGPLRETFGAAAARAVGSIAYVAELGLPLLRKGGRLIVPKGPTQRAEVDGARSLIAALGGVMEICPEPPVAGEVRHGFVAVIRKEAPTPFSYPRRPPRLGTSPSDRRG